MKDVEVTTGISPVTGVSRREAVTTALRDAILTRRLHPGERLPEVALAKDLGVSRPTLKEAVNQLVHEGLLVREEYKGITVATVTSGDIHDIATVRSALEVLAATSIAESGDAAVIAELEIAFAAYQRAAASGDASLENIAHLAFHQAIWLASGNSMLERMWPIVSTPINLALSTDMAEQHENAEHRLAMHRKLLDAIESGAVPAITAAVHEHIDLSAQRLMARLDAQA